MFRLRKGIATIGGIMVLLGLVTAVADLSGAESPEEFYRGKNPTWIVAATPGSGTDLKARTIAPFLAREIGAKVRIENRKTDEGVNYVYLHGTRDGLTLGIKDNDSIIGNEILKAPGVQYETDKFNFVADVSPATKMFQVSPKLPYKTLEALRKAKDLRAGATSAKGALAVSSAVMFDVLGLHGKVIAGFNGVKELTIAIARGEIDFMVISDGQAARDEKDGYVVNIFALGNKRSTALPQVPSLAELGVKVAKEGESVYKFIISSGTSVMLPPGVPPERVEYMRRAFQRLSNNEEVQKAMEKVIGERRAFRPGEEVQEEMAAIKSDKELAVKLNAIFNRYTALR